MQLAVVIVNYRTGALVCNCLSSLHNVIRGGSCRVVVVDNDSSDGSVERIQSLVGERRWEGWITVLPQKRNRGFAAGNNAALHYLFDQSESVDGFLLLNPDTLVHSGALDFMANFLETHPEVGIVGAQLEDAECALQSSGRRFPSVLSELDAAARLGTLSRLLSKWQVVLPLEGVPHRCDWVSGAAMMVRREVFEDIGLLDEDYFLYFEELDFCHRARRAGWQTWLEPAARVTHLEGAATGIQQGRKRRGSYWYDSRRRYFIKNHGLMRLILADIFWGVGRLSLLLRIYARMGGDVSGDPVLFTRDLLLGDFFALINGSALRNINHKKITKHLK